MRHFFRFLFPLLAIPLFAGCCYQNGYYDPSTGLVHRGGVRQLDWDVDWNPFDWFDSDSCDCQHHRPAPRVQGGCVPCAPGGIPGAIGYPGSMPAGTPMHPGNYPGGPVPQESGSSYPMAPENCEACQQNSPPVTTSPSVPMMDESGYPAQEYYVPGNTVPGGSSYPTLQPPQESGEPNPAPPSEQKNSSGNGSAQGNLNRSPSRQMTQRLGTPSQTQWSPTQVR